MSEQIFDDKDDLFDAIQERLEDEIEARTLSKLATKLGLNYPRLQRFAYVRMRRRTNDDLIDKLADHYGFKLAEAPPAFMPPAGWLRHPQDGRFYYKGQEVLTEAQLRERMALEAAE